MFTTKVKKQERKLERSFLFRLMAQDEVISLSFRLEICLTLFVNVLNN